jgi:hypothetical protein
MESDEFTIYSTGVVYASVCSSLSAEDTAQRLNTEMPSGVQPWKLADEPFNNGAPNPCLCDRNPKTHKHYLFNC